MNIEKLVDKFEKAKDRTDRAIGHDENLHVIITSCDGDSIYYKSNELTCCYDGMSFNGGIATPENLLARYNDCHKFSGDEMLVFGTVLKEATHNLNYWRRHKKKSW